MNCTFVGNARHWPTVFLAVLCIAGAWPGARASGQDPRWVTVDEFRYEGFEEETPAFYTSPSGVLVDGEGVVFVCGYTTIRGRGGLGRWLVRRSRNGGLTWQTVDVFFHWHGDRRTAPTPAIMGLDKKGNVYAASSTSRVFLRRSTDGGDTWSTVFGDPNDPVGSGTFGIDTAGEVLFIANGSGLHASSDAGDSWELRSTGEFNRLVAFPGGLLAAKDLLNGGETVPKVLARSTDGGRNWSVVHSLWEPWDSFLISVTDLIATPSGTVYASLLHFSDGIPQNYSWILEQSSSWGSSWETVEEQTRLPLLVEAKLHEDPEDFLYAAGALEGVDGSRIWTVLRSTDGGRTWAGSDSFQGFGNNYWNWPVAIAGDRQGNIYVVGPQSPGSGQVWFVRKLPSADAPPEPRFRRGDADGSGAVDITDAVYTLEHLFLGGAEPGCPDAADADDSGGLDVTDAVYSLQALFLGGPALPAPGLAACGPDPSQDGLSDCLFDPSRC